MPSTSEFAFTGSQSPFQGAAERGRCNGPPEAGTACLTEPLADVPAARVLSYAWQGSDSKKNVATARSALEAELEERGIEDAEFRILGYNGPGTPRAKRTWELQALLD